jgi:hypothetical protein
MSRPETSMCLIHASMLSFSKVAHVCVVYSYHTYTFIWLNMNRHEILEMHHIYSHCSAGFGSLVVKSMFVQKPVAWY